MSGEAPDRPLPNCYWVIPGRLLAGEHPRCGASHVAQLRERLRLLMDAGIDSFVDLTMPAEFDSYEGDLPPGVQYARKPIRDHDLPEEPEQMVDILAHIERELGGGRRVYFHCHAGIGRTGTVAGCLLVERGNAGEAALDALNRLWRQCERSQSWPIVPETDDQSDYVRNWRVKGRSKARPRTAAHPAPAQAPMPVAAIPPAAISTVALAPATMVAASAAQGVAARAVLPGGAERVRDRFHGTLLGLAVGDALAVPTQGLKMGSFQPVTTFAGGGDAGLPAGAWTDDTAMAMCVAESFAECGAFDPHDQVERLEAWQLQGHLSATGECVAITPGTARALAAARWRRQVFPGSHDPKQLDPEVLSRVGPAVLFAAGSLDDALHLACETSRLTCQAPGALDACRLFAASLHAAIMAAPKGQILAPPVELVDATGVRGKVADLLERSANRPPRAGKAVAEALAAVYWAFATTDDFQEGALKAANLGARADVVAAAYGQLAGAYYGAAAIPRAWRDALLNRTLITGFADRLLASGPRR